MERNDVNRKIISGIGFRLWKMGRFSFSLLAGVDVLLKRPILVFLSYHQAEGGKRTLYLIAIAKVHTRANVEETGKNYFMDLAGKFLHRPTVRPSNGATIQLSDRPTTRP